MPRSRDEIPDYMSKIPGRTDQFKGQAYRCKHCKGIYWTQWANAWRHDCRDTDE